jgi:hypothetical protein
MDESLFLKHALQIKRQQSVKSDVIEQIKVCTGIELTNEEISVTKKIVTIQTSSVKRTFLIQKNIKGILEEKGYSVKM